MILRQEATLEVPLQTADGNPSSKIADLVVSAVSDLADAGLEFEPGLVHRYVAALAAKRFVILTGLSGSGKSRLAQGFAMWLTDATATSAKRFAAGSWVPADRITYYVNDVDRLSAEFWNHDDPEKAVRVSLPWTLIDQWAACITANGFTRSTPARTIRELVDSEYRQYSPQQNSFETLLKAAAFAVLEAGKVPAGGDHYTVVAVGADWTSNEQVVGYPDALNPGRYVRTPILNLVLSAHRSPAKPHFLILDEMNLSHVERYFADFLSAMESGEPIRLHSAMDSDGHIGDVPSSITVPDNLFVIGTVNVDETTYAFSPKVLDRANTIEFRVAPSQIASALGSSGRPDVTKLAGAGVSFANAFMNLARQPLLVRDDRATTVRHEMTLLFEVLAAFGLEFGIRTAHEVARFVGAHETLASSVWDVRDAIDAQIYQKMLPRLNGSRSQLEPVLIALGVFCAEPRVTQAVEASQTDSATGSIAQRALLAATGFDERALLQGLDGACYPLSLGKIQRMHQRLLRNGFTSFAEA
jgi:hypothetical protein